MKLPAFRHFISVTCLIAAVFGSASAQTLRSVSVSPASVAGGKTSTGTVTISAKAGTEGISVSLTSASTAASVPGSVTVPSGKTTATFSISTSPVAATTSASIKGSLGSSTAKATLTITAAKLGSLSFSPSTVTGGGASTLTLALGSPAPNGGITASLTSSSPAWGGPSSITVPAGAVSGTASCTTTAVTVSTTARVTAKASGGSVSGSLTIKPSALAGLTLSPTQVGGGGTSIGTVSLTGLAPKGGDKVTLTSSAKVATVPSSVTVPAGASTVTFTVGTSPVTTSTTSKITAKMGSVSSSQVLTVIPLAVSNLAVNPGEIVGGASSTGTVTLNAPASGNGAIVSLSSTAFGLSFPNTVTVPTGNTTANFAISTVPVATANPATISAKFSGSSAVATLTIDPPKLTALTLSPTTVLGGASAAGTVTISSPAPSAGLTIQLGTTSAQVSVPATITVPAGTTTGTFTLQTFSGPTTLNATISAGFNNISTTAQITIQAPQVTQLTVQPTSVIGTASATGTVTINTAAPATGIAVVLSSSSNSVSIPASVTVAGGATTATFTIGTSAVTSPQNVTLTATLGKSVSAQLTVTPIEVVSLSLNPTSIQAGSTSSGTVTLNAAAPTGGFIVSLISNSAAATVPQTVTVAAGATSAKFTITGNAVGAATTATITASDPSDGLATAKLTVTIQLVQILNLQINDITFDSVSGKIFAAEQNDNTQYGNCILRIDPGTGAIEKSYSVGVQLGKVRVTSDGKYAYTDSPADGSVRRVNLQTGLVDGTYPIHFGGVYDLETVPGSPQSFMISGNPNGGVNTNIYDVATSVSAIARPNTVPTGIAGIFNGDGSILYGDGYTNGGGGDSLFVSTVTPTLVNWVHQYGISVRGGVWYNNLIYTASPSIVDPINQIVQSSLPLTDFLVDREVGVNAPDNRIYYVSWDSGHNKRILSFDLTTLTEYPWFDTGSIPGGCNSFIACGNHTVAFYIYGYNVTQNLVIVRGLP